MFKKKRIYQLLASVAMFFLGFAFQALLEHFFPVTNAIDLGIAAILVVVTFVLAMSINILYTADTKFEIIDGKIEEIIKRTGVTVEYIQDNLDGKSYKRSTQLIENARLSIIFVSPWDPTMEYTPDIYSEEVRVAKQKYYEAIKKSISKFIGKDLLFHRRLLQVPPESIDDLSLSFKIDSSFYDYLRYAAKIQRAYPRDCLLRIAAEKTSEHFTIIDDRYVILSTVINIKDGHKVRHGEVIIDDGQGELVKYFNFLYQTLDAHSRPLEPRHFKEQPQ